MITSENYYNILGISKDCSNSDLKKAYRKLALKWHPDKNIDKKDVAETNFKKVCEAYEVLSDPKKREIYDKYGKEGINRDSCNNGENVRFMDPNEIFRQFFSGSGFMQGFPPINIKKKWRRGTNVELVGLVNKCYLNNKIGEIIDYDELKNRYMVKLIGEIVSIKVKNMVPLVRNIKVYNTSKDTLNGKTGNIIGYINNRYKVKLFIGKTVSLKSENIVWPKNTLLYIHSLKGSNKYNGEIGIVEEYNDDRYIINVSNRKKLKLKRSNISLINLN